VFGGSTQSSSLYGMLLGHTRSSMMGILQKHPAEYEVWVRVWGMEVLDLTRVPATSSAIFIWRLRKQLLEDMPEPMGASDRSCWLTECIEREKIEPDPRMRWAGL